MQPRGFFEEECQGEGKCAPRPVVGINGRTGRGSVRPIRGKERIESAGKESVVRPVVSPDRARREGNGAAFPGLFLKSAPGGKWCSPSGKLFYRDAGSCGIGPYGGKAGISGSLHPRDHIGKGENDEEKNKNAGWLPSDCGSRLFRMEDLRDTHGLPAGGGYVQRGAPEIRHNTL